MLCSKKKEDGNYNTLIPFAASLRRLRCCVSASVRLLRPRKMIGSELASNWFLYTHPFVLTFLLTITNDNAKPALQRLVGNSIGKINSKQHFISATGPLAVSNRRLQQ